MSLLKFNDKLEQGLCLSAVGISLLFVILGLVALFTDNRVLMLVAALFLGLSILLTIGLPFTPDSTKSHRTNSVFDATRAPVCDLMA